MVAPKKPITDQERFNAYYLEELTAELPPATVYAGEGSEHETEAGRGAAISNTAPPNQQSLAVGGVDTMALMFFLSPDSSSPSPSSMTVICEELEKIKALAQEQKGIVFHEVKGHLLEVQQSGESKAGPYFSVVFHWESLRIAISKADPDKAANFYVYASGSCMLQHSWNAFSVYDKVRGLIKDLGLEVQKETISRLDVHCDIIGQSMREFLRHYESREYVCRGGRFSKVFESYEIEEITQEVQQALNQSEEKAIQAVRKAFKVGTKRAMQSLQEVLNARTLDVVRFGTGKASQTIQFGKSRLVMRIYDKQAELKSQHPERHETMLEIWGCDEKTPVTRIEYQLRSDALRGRGITTFTEAMESLASLTHYLVDEWCVIRENLDRRATKRAPISKLWQYVQHCFREVFDSGHKPLRKRYIAPRFDDAKQLVKQAAGCLRQAVGRVFGHRDNPEDFLNACIHLMYQGFGGSLQEVQEQLHKHWEQTEQWYHRVAIHNRKVANPVNWDQIDATLTGMFGQRQAVTYSIDPTREGLTLN